MKDKSSPEPIHVIGTDAGGLENLASKLKQLVLTAKKVAGPSRILKTFPEWWLKKNKPKPLPELFVSDKPIELISWLKEQQEQTVLLASGDPLWFGIGRQLLESIPSNRLHFHPSTTSFQLAFSRIGRPWQDVSWVSLHGRDATPLNKCLQQRPKALAILADPKRCGAKEIRQILRASGLEHAYAFWVCEQLGHPQERVQEIMRDKELPNDLNPLHLVVLIEEVTKMPSELPLFGIEDGLFLQYADRPGLMTKREIRAQLLADLELPKKGVLWDIGAGVGSIGLEALRLRPQLNLMALEKRTGGAALIKANAIRLTVKPSLIIEEDALDFLTKGVIEPPLNNPDRVLLGGGGIHRKELLEAILKKLGHGGIVVIPLATLEAIPELETVLKANNCKTSISQHQSFRGIPLGNGTRLAPMNPVFVLKGVFL